MTEAAQIKLSMTLRALIRRNNRKPKGQHRLLHASRRNSRWWRDLGDFYVIDVNRNMIIDSNVDPEEYAREIKVLKPFEEVVDQPEALL